MKRILRQAFQGIMIVEVMVVLLSVFLPDGWNADDVYAVRNGISGVVADNLQLTVAPVQAASVGRSFGHFINMAVVAVAALFVVSWLVLRVRKRYGGRVYGRPPGADFTSSSGGVYYGDGMKGIGHTFSGGDNKEEQEKL